MWSTRHDRTHHTIGSPAPVPTYPAASTELGQMRPTWVIQGYVGHIDSFGGRGIIRPAATRTFHAVALRGHCHRSHARCSCKTMCAWSIVNAFRGARWSSTGDGRPCCSASRANRLMMSHTVGCFGIDEFWPHTVSPSLVDGRSTRPRGARPTLRVDDVLPRRRCGCRSGRIRGDIWASFGLPWQPCGPFRIRHCAPRVRPGS